MMNRTIRWWPIMVFVWSVMAISIYIQVVANTPMGHARAVIYVVLNIGVAFIFNYWLNDILLPIYMKRQQLSRFFLIGLIFCLLMGLIFALIDTNFYYQPVSFIVKWCSMMISALLITGSISGLRFYREHAVIERKHRILQQAHHEIELKLLRDQVNPHFLFNVINSIHVLMRKDVKQADSLLLKFSDMLRHHLYDSSKEYIMLGEEIAYLQNYINVEMIRWGADVAVECEWPDTTEDYYIAPFLLSPFVENAFKFVSRDREEGNYVKVWLEMKGNELTMKIENTFDTTSPAEGLPKAGGIGLENVKKRLSLLYANQHEWQIRQEEQVFHVNLTIQLHRL